MSDNYKRRDLVVFAHEHVLTDPNQMIADAQRRFPGVSTEELRWAFEVVDFENDERHREHMERYAQERPFMDEIGKMFEGLPEGTRLDDAVKIKAAQGNAFAIKYLAYTRTKAYRAREALSEAAYAAHPLFEQRGDVIYWLGDLEDEPSDDAVVEWFQINHPAAAREIERKIEEETT
jgi:hypothetical protein